MLLDRAIPKQGKTRCKRGLITEPIGHVVTDADADFFKTKSAVWRGNRNPLKCTYL